MGTPFRIIRKFIRAALLDNDKDAFLYSDEALDDQIRFSNLTLDENGSHSEVMGTEDEDHGTGSFTHTLTNQQVLILTIKTAIRILTGVPDNFVYQSPVLSVSRRGGTHSLLLSLRALLDEVEGGGFAIAIDTDFNALTQGFQRYYNGVSQSTTAWSGVFSG